MSDSLAHIKAPYQQPEIDLDPFRQAVYDLLRPFDPKAADRYARCGEGLEWVGFCEHCETARPDFHAYHVTTSCMNRICYNCGETVARPIRDRYRPLIEWAFQNMPRGWSIKHVVLTRSVELSQDAGGDAYQTIEYAMELAERLFLRFKGSGIIATLETGETGHKFHAHMIVLSPFVPQALISQTWSEITGGDSIVYVRRMESADAAIREGLKYITKVSHMSPEQLVSLHLALKGKRRVRSRGFFYVHKKHPLYDHIQGLREPSHGCPDCGRKLRHIHVIEFLQLAGLRTMIDSSTVARAIEGLHDLRRRLNLKEAIKSGSDPP